MTRRQIITIDEEKCNGCGQCVTACSEGALKIVDGKAKLVKDQFCDGFGDCMGECPTGALKIEEKEVAEYDPAATRGHVAKTMGEAGVRRFDQAAQRHDAKHHVAPVHAGCPGMQVRSGTRKTGQSSAAPSGAGPAGHMIPSELQQWPVQIHLVQPGAPFFKNRELVVLSTCSPIASADVHWRFIRGRAVVVGCPKLDDTSPYAEKLAAIFSEPSIPKVTVVRMEVPCCGGLTAIVEEAAANCGRKDLEVEEVTVSLDGDVTGTRRLA